MRKANNSSWPTLLKGIVKRTIGKAIQTIGEAIHEKRCTVCTTPFIPVTQAIHPQNFPNSRHTPSRTPSASQDNTAHTPHQLIPNSNKSSPSIGFTLPPHPPLGSYAEALSAACFCANCSHALPRLTTGFCPLCGDLSPWPLAPKSLCRNCLTHTPPWDSALFHGPYEGLLRTMLLDHKFSGVLSLGYALGRLLARHPSLNALLFDTIIPVPLHPQRLQQRGYNQSLEIAKGLHSCFRHQNIKLYAHHLQRALPTRPQMGLSHTERQKNVRGVFTLTKPCANRHILLIDDVYTTGSTLRECATVLKKNGAASVHIATLARTRRQRLKIYL